jgi:hypothetical protein
VTVTVTSLLLSPRRTMIFTGDFAQIESLSLLLLGAARPATSLGDRATFADFIGATLDKLLIPDGLSFCCSRRVETLSFQIR